MFLLLLALSPDMSALPGHFQLSPHLPDKGVSNRTFNFLGKKKQKEKRSSSAILCFKRPLDSKVHRRAHSFPQEQVMLLHTSLLYPGHFLLQKNRNQECLGPFQSYVFPAVLTIWRSSLQNTQAVAQQVGSGSGVLGGIPLGFLQCVPSMLPQAWRLCHVQK